MKIATLIVRSLLGLMFLVFGLNFFLKFFPMPEPPPGRAGQFATVLTESGYFKAVKIFEIAGGALLLSGFFVPLGLVLLGPVIVNIAFYHLFLAEQADPVGFLPLVLEAFLIYAYRRNFEGIFAIRATPSA